MKIKSTMRVLLTLLLFCVFLTPPAPAQTSQPTLRIASSNGLSAVRWPLTASNFILQATTDLSPTAMWTNLATGDQIVSLNTFPAIGGYASYITNVAGDEMAFSLPAINWQQFFRLSSPPLIPACCFVIFYNGLLEFTGAATMSVNGRVHANGPIYVGTTASLIFFTAVTTTTTVSAPLVNGISSGWIPGTPSTWNTTFNTNFGSTTNFTSLGIPGLNQTNCHFLIDIPPASEDSMSSTGQLRLFNQAQMILLVTNDINGAINPMVTMTIQASVNGAVPGNDPAKAVYVYTNQSSSSLAANLPFLNLTNRFYEQREYKTNLVTQIDVGSFVIWGGTNSIVQSKLPSAAGLYPTILYVADCRNMSVKELAVVRLNNGAQLPANGGLGFSVVTPNPLYILGKYNIQTNSGGPQSVTTNTDYTVPAALMSDALTILASTWTDITSYSTYSTSVSAYDAADTIINAAIVTGTMPTTGTTAATFSGGVQNLPRLLQDWSGKNLWLNTSIIRLWDSQMATNQFRNPAGYNPTPLNPYYNPPTRHFNFDPNFENPHKLPPGIPMLEVTP